MKPDDFIASWTRARKLPLLYVNVKISALVCHKGSQAEIAAITQDTTGPSVTMFLCVRSSKYWHIDNEHETQNVSFSCWIRLSVTFQGWPQGGAAEGQTVSTCVSPTAETWARPWCVAWETQSEVLPDCWAGGNWEERELEGREQRIWGEVANLVITFAAATAAAATPPVQERSRQNNTR